MFPHFTESDRARLHAGFVPDRDCRRWSGAHNAYGYGVIRVAGQTVLVHRAVLELAVGPPPADMYRPCACHACDVPDCDEVAHLRWDTRQKNMQDRDDRGRTARGDANGSRTKPRRAQFLAPPPSGHGFITESGRAILTEQGAIWCLNRDREGYSAPAIADALGIATKTVWCLIEGRTWKHLHF